MGAMDVRPSGLPPSATLLVRSLGDATPQAKKPMDPARVDWAWLRTWERHLRRRLEEVLRHAVRPVGGRIPPGAGAVLFLDDAEARAALAVVQTSGRAALDDATWWTSSVTSTLRLPETASAADVLASKPSAAPAVWHVLHTWGRDRDVARALSEPDAERLLRATCDAFGVDVPRFSSSTTSAQRLQPRHFRTAPDDSILHAASAGERCRAVSLHLYRSPQIILRNQILGDVSRESFESQSYSPITAVSVSQDASRSELETESPTASVDRFKDEGQLDDSHVPSQQTEVTDLSSPPDSETPSVPSAEAATEARKEATDSGSTASPVSETHQPQPFTERSVDFEESILEKDDPKSGKLELTSTDALIQPKGRFVEHAEEAAPHPALPADALPEEVSASPRALPTPAFTTLGGLFYLVNVAEAMDLAGVIRESLPDVGAWAVVEAVGRVLLNESALRAEWTADPVWRVFAMLDGRDPDHLAGHSAEIAARPFRRPEAWSEEADPIDSTHRASAHAAPVPGCAPALSAWARHVAPYVRARLRSALGGPAKREWGAAGLFVIDATVHLSPLHVDVVFPLDAARLDVRCAGLDRDPGWCPVFGRVVRFHFRS